MNSILSSITRDGSRRGPSAFCTLTGRLRAFASTLASALYEIFDESAYERFLKENNLVRSAGSYAVFVQDQQVAKARRVRCC